MKPIYSIPNKKGLRNTKFSVEGNSCFTSAAAEMLINKGLKIYCHRVEKENCKICRKANK